MEFKISTELLEEMDSIMDEAHEIFPTKLLNKTKDGNKKEDINWFFIENILEYESYKEHKNKY